MECRKGRLQPEQLEPRQLLAIDMPIISELMAINDNTVADGFGEFPDWIEIHNPTASPVDLQGMHLTDDSGQLDKWQFSQVALEPGGYLLVFASGQNEARTGADSLVDPLGFLHTNFRLSGQGEFLALVGTDGSTILQQFGQQFPPQLPNLSYGIDTGDRPLALVGEGAELSFLVPSRENADLGTSWSEVDFDDSSWTDSLTVASNHTVKITEITNGDGGGFRDSAEVENVSGRVLDTQGWIVLFNDARRGINSVHGVNEAGPVLELPGMMPPGSAGIQTYIDRSGRDNNINWSDDDNGWTMILDDDGNVVDFVIWGYTDAELALFDVTINGNHITFADFSDFWNGGSVLLNTFGNDSSLKRSGLTDHDDQSDFRFSSGFSLGDENTDLTVPFPQQVQVPAATSVGFDNATSTSPLGDLINTDLAKIMRGVNSSVWLRMPFEVDDLSRVDQLVLNLTYDDGFLAYLNGQLVAQSNSPENPTWNSQATAERGNDTALGSMRFDLSDHINDLALGQNVLAIHGLNHSAEDGDFLISPNLVLTRQTPDAIPPARFFGIPTPGEANDASVAGPAGNVTIDTPGRTFQSGTSLLVSLAVDSPTAEIRYTLDGTVPSVTSQLWDGTPIGISTTTQLRARAVQKGFADGPIEGAGYIALESSGESRVDRSSSNLPIVVLENFGGPPVGTTEFRDFHFTLIEPHEDTGRASLTDTPTVSSRLGMHIRGQSSQSFGKKQYRIELRDQNDDDLAMELLGMPAEADWVLNGPWVDKALIRNSLGFELGNALGVLAPRTRHVEAYLHQDGEALAEDDYIGTYILVEDIKIGENRVDVPQLDVGDVAEPDISGGYLLRFEEAPEGVKLQGWRSLELVDDNLYTPEQVQWISDHINAFDAALPEGNNFGTVDFRNFIDEDSWINHIVLNELIRDQDSYVASSYMYKDRDGKLFQGPLWDLNLTLGVGCCHDNRNTSGWQFDVNVGDVFFTQGEREWNRRMFMDPDWSQLFIDRWHQARQDVLELTNLYARIDRHIDPLIESQAHNFATFANVLGNGNPGFPSPASDTWQEQIAFIKDQWLTPRIAWMDSQFVPAPDISLRGGAVTDTVNVTFALPTSGVLHYTLDGTDPREAGGGVSSSAIIYTGGEVAVPNSTQIMARVFDTSVNPVRTGLVHTQWSAPTAVEAVNQFAAQPGDANRDRQFDSKDIVQVLAAGKYETGLPSTFEEGDWNGDDVFNQLDIVAALQTGNYLQGPYAARDSGRGAAHGLAVSEIDSHTDADATLVDLLMGEFD